MTALTIPCSSHCPKTAPKNQRLDLYYSRGIVVMPSYPYKYSQQGGRRMRSLSTNRCFLMDVVVRSSVDPEGPLASGASPGSNWKLWLFGMVISVVLPFWKSKWGPLLKLKNEVDAVVETAEEVVEAVEKVAEGVEKVAEDVVEMLPEGGKLRKVAECVEHAAEVTAKDAHLVDGLIDKVQELEEDVEEGLESILDRKESNRPAAGRDVVAKEGDEPAGSVQAE